jgi:hypothetical protein
MNVKVGDVVMIYRTEDFNDVKTLFFREVSTIPIEGYTRSKKLIAARK